MPIIRTHKVGVAAVLFNEHGLVCLQERIKSPGNGLLVLPGGRLDETLPDVGIRRELLEELGLAVGHIEPCWFAGVDDALHNVGTTNDYLMLYFTCQVLTNHVSNLEPDKCKGIVWRHPYNLPREMWAADRVAIASATRMSYSWLHKIPRWNYEA